MEQLTALQDRKSGRHFDDVNVGFADGHAKWLESSTVFNSSMRANNGGCDPEVGVS